MAKHNTNIFKKIFSKKVRLSNYYFDKHDPENFKVVFTWRNKGKNTLVINGPNYKNPNTCYDRNEVPGIILEINTMHAIRDSYSYDHYEKNLVWSIYNINLMLTTLDILLKSWVIVRGEIHSIWAATCKDEEYFHLKKILEGS